MPLKGSNKNEKISNTVLIYGVIIIITLATIPAAISVNAGYDILNVPSDYATIQAAVEASSDGDTVYISPGVYVENIFINKSIKLIGESKDTTILAGEKNGDVIYIEDCSVELMNICVEESGISVGDAGIELKNADNCKIIDVKAQKNYYGISNLFSSNITIKNSVICGNYYGVFTYFSSNLTILHTIFCNNFRQGFYSQASKNNHIRNNTLSHNVKEGIYLRASCNNTIRENYVSNSDYGIYFLLSDKNSVINNTIANNEIGMYIDGGVENTIYHNNLYNNLIFNAKDISHNYWDNGYPSGGNYWSNFDEPAEGAYDKYQGSNQDIQGSDGICDSEHFVIGGNKDRYSLMGFWKVNDPPKAAAGGSYTGNEGISILFNASESYDPDLDELQYRWDFTNDGVWDTVYSRNSTALYTFYDDYSGTAVVECFDGKETKVDTTTLTVHNVAPIVFIDNLNQLQDGFLLPNHTIEFSGSFIDPGIEDTHIIEWNFGDGTTAEGILMASHTYIQSGIYSVILRVTDDDGGVGAATGDIVVFSPIEATKAVIENIEVMNLSNGINSSLVSKLDSAIDSLEKGNDDVAINKFEAFIHQVEALREKKLTDEETNTLIEVVQGIIEHLEN